MAHCRIAFCAFVLLAWAPHPGRRSVSLPAQPGSDISRRVLHPFVGLGGKGWVQSPPETQPEPERGYAAFYSVSLEGHKTACGGTYSPEKLTAAHAKLPCGTKLQVTNLRNGKSVRVTVNDHGPFHGNRIIDLSYAAARRLDFLKQGTTLVKLEVVR